MLVVQILFVALALGLGGRRLLHDWTEVRTTLANVKLSWSFAVASTIPIVVGYGVLIETWRVMLRAWGASLSRRHATTIYFISNLGRYIPGKFWQIAAMSGMAQRCGVSPMAAAGSSLVVNLVNIATGFLVVLASGARVLSVANGSGGSGTGTRVAVILAAAIGVSFLSLPWTLPPLVRAGARLTGNMWSLLPVPPRAMWVAVVGTAAAWVLYGLGFQILARAVWGAAPGGAGGYIAAFTMSYLIGYLALLAPGGIVVREVALVEALRVLGLATPADGLVLALASRLWLTLLEIVLGLMFVPWLLRLPTSPPTDASTEVRA